MKVGFTGTRRGMTKYQYNTVETLLKRISVKEGHHGDCKGADAQFHEICVKLDIPVVIHPPINPKWRAFCKSNKILPEKEYIERDRDIVDECDILVACPKGEKEERRSGTWTTVRYAKKTGVKVIVVYPMNRGNDFW